MTAGAIAGLTQVQFGGQIADVGDVSLGRFLHVDTPWRAIIHCIGHVNATLDRRLICQLPFWRLPAGRSTLYIMGGPDGVKQVRDDVSASE
jgi:hypothetical protein